LNRRHDEDFLAGVVAAAKSNQERLRLEARAIASGRPVRGDDRARRWYRRQVCGQAGGAMIDPSRFETTAVSLLASGKDPVKRLNDSTRLLIAFVGGATAFLLGASLLASEGNIHPGQDNWLLDGMFLAAAVLAGRFPLPLGQHSKVSVDTAVFTAIALTLGVPEAIVVSAASVVVAQSMARCPASQIAFNAAQTGLYVGLGSLTFAVLTDRDAGLVAAIVAGAVVMHLANTLLVSTVGALESGWDPLHTWRVDLWLDLPEHVALVIFGVLMAMVGADHPWALPIFALPLAIVYVSLDRSGRARVGMLAVVESLASIVEMRDPDKIGHSERVADWVERLAQELRIPAWEAKRIRAAARVHDVGKVALDPALLQTQGSLSRYTWEQVHQHPIVGAQLVESLPAYVHCAPFIRHHHERWDGSGYPDGLAGDTIPVGARMIAVADAFDALTSPRPHRAALGTEAALRELERGAGTQWDPALVGAFVAIVRPGKTDARPSDVFLVRPDAGEALGATT
jgi:HD-GYP domain-containing protein (c-di-GMP phosphodiesterase class II)